GGPGPLTWSHRSVADQVEAIDRELAERARHRAERRQRESALRDAVGDLDAARTRRDEAQRRLDDLRTRHGFTIGPDVHLGAWLHATRDLADVTSQLAAVQAAGSRLFERVNRTAADLKRFLVEVGAKTTEATESLEHDQLHAALRELARQVEQRDADRARLVGLERERERAGDAIRRMVSERSRLLDEASVVDDADADVELRRRIDHLQDWRDQSEKLRLANAAVSQLELRIEHDGRFGLVATGDDEALHTAAAECRAASGRSEERAEAMHRTKDDIQRAASDRTIERATSRLAEATEELTAHRDEALRLEAAHFLL